MKMYFFALALGISALYLVAYSQEIIQGQVQTNSIPKPTITRLIESQDRMERTYTTLNAVLSDHRRKKLYHAQFDWNNYSQSECVFSAEKAPGEAEQNTYYQECLISKNEDRLNELNNHIQQNTPWDPSLADIPRQKAN